MQIEIHTPKLEERVQKEIQSGRYRDADELLAKALDALDEKTSTSPSCAAPSQTGAALLRALEASPYPEIDLTPPRVPIVVRDISF